MARALGLVPRTQRSVPLTVRCRAVAHLAESATRVAWVPALRSRVARCCASGTRERCQLPPTHV